MHTIDPKRILSISYDESLLLTRQLILEVAGYSVVSAIGFSRAKELCRDEVFDLVILGHAIPPDDRKMIFTMLRAMCTTPILALHKANEGNLEGAEYQLDSSEGPEALIRKLKKIFDGK